MAENQHKPDLGLGVLFTNHKKNHPKSPDFTGQIMLAEDGKAGDIIKIGAWERNTNKGKLLSLKQDTWKPSGQPVPKEYPVEVNSGKNEDEVPW